MLTHAGTKTIETERLLLRRFAYSDIDSMIRNWIADEQPHKNELWIEQQAQCLCAFTADRQ